MVDTLTKIPGTLYSTSFGTDGKFYAVYLYRGSQQVQMRRLEITKGQSLKDLPEEVDTAIKKMLHAQELFLNPVTIDRVVEELVEKVPKSGEISGKGVKPRPDLVDKKSVKDLIEKSENRAQLQKEQKETVEFAKPPEPTADAVADKVPDYNLKKPKPLPERKEDALETPTKEVPVKKQAANKKQAAVAEPEENKEVLTAQIEELKELVKKNKNAITGLKRQITMLKKKVED